MAREIATAGPSGKVVTDPADSTPGRTEENQDQRLDEAPEETFPASDPISSSKVD